MNGKCPHCKGFVTQLLVSTVDGNVLGGKSWKTNTYSCPLCQSIISCEIDPIALKFDTVNEVVAEVMKRLR